MGNCAFLAQQSHSIAVLKSHSLHSVDKEGGVRADAAAFSQCDLNQTNLQRSVFKMNRAQPDELFLNQGTRETT